MVFGMTQEYIKELLKFVKMYKRFYVFEGELNYDLTLTKQYLVASFYSLFYSIVRI